MKPNHVEAHYDFKIPLYVYTHLLVSLPALTCSGVALNTTNFTRTASMEMDPPPHGGRPAPNRLSHRTDLNTTTELPYNTNNLVQGSYETDTCYTVWPTCSVLALKPGVRLVFNYRTWSEGSVKVKQSLGRLGRSQEVDKVVSLTHRPPLPTRKYSCYSFLLEAESTPGS